MSLLPPQKPEELYDHKGNCLHGLVSKVVYQDLTRKCGVCNRMVHAWDAPPPKRIGAPSPGLRRKYV